MLWLQENICHGFWMSHTVAAHLYCSVCGQEPTCSRQIAASSMVRMNIPPLLKTVTSTACLLQSWVGGLSL